MANAMLTAASANVGAALSQAARRLAGVQDANAKLTEVAGDVKSRAVRSRARTRVASAKLTAAVGAAMSQAVVSRVQMQTQNA